MGTNYYLHTNAFSDKTKLHIGKSSAGWTFALHVHPDEGINSLDDWKRSWKKGTIKDEYGQKISPKEMSQIVEGRFWDKSRLGKWYAGYASAKDFHTRNHSELGPNNLIRSQVDGKHCIGHGNGTWDLIIGHFS